VLFGLGNTASDVSAQITWRDHHGALHRESLSLSPGYHTVVLGEQEGAGK